MLNELKDDLKARLRLNLPAFGQTPVPAGPAAPRGSADGMAPPRAERAKVLGLSTQAMAEWSQGPRRGCMQPVLQREHYNYVPSLMHEGGLYRMWWGGGVAGDFILYAEAKSLDGPWAARKVEPFVAPAQVSLRPTQDRKHDGFDAKHTCDPNVVRVGDLYYLYYGGKGYRAPYDLTHVGVALSRDGGFTFERLNAGLPIVKPERARMDNTYGAGQPTVFVKHGAFHMAYTDTTGCASNPDNGSGIYCLRSPDPTFQRHVEVMTGAGFVRRSSLTGRPTDWALIQAFSVDWTYVASQDVVAMATTRPDHRGCTLRFWDLAGRRATRDAQLTTPSQEQFVEGGGIVRDPSGHALQASGVALRMDVMHAMVDHSGRSGPNSWTGLGYYGADIVRKPDLLGRVLRCVDRPLALAEDPCCIQFDARPLPPRFPQRVVDIDAETYDRLSMRPAQQADYLRLMLPFRDMRDLGQTARRRLRERTGR